MKAHKLTKEKQKALKNIPLYSDVVRGTFIKVYLKCVNKRCKCHKDKKYRHGPFYRISYGKGTNKVHHIYVPLKWMKQAKKWTNNYNKLWNSIEKISHLNIKIMKAKNV